MLCMLLANSLVVHTDETGWSIKSVWAFLSEKARVIFFGVPKDATTLEQISDPAKFGGILISDDAAVYANFTHAQKCWAHLLRKAIKLTVSANSLLLWGPTSNCWLPGPICAENQSVAAGAPTGLHQTAIQAGEKVAICDRLRPLFSHRLPGDIVGGNAHDHNSLRRATFPRYEPDATQNLISSAQTPSHWRGGLPWKIRNVEQTALTPCHSRKERAARYAQAMTGPNWQLGTGNAVNCSCNFQL